MRNDILIGIIITLLNEGKCSYSYLAEKYEVSKKTIQRYMEVLEMAGIPTISHAGRYGGTEIISSFNLENNFFSKQELARLLTHLEASPLATLDNLDQAIKEKLTQCLKEIKHTPPIDNYIIDYTSWGQLNTSSPLIKFLVEKLNKQQTFQMNYISSMGQASSRTISPYKLIFKDFKWYLFAYCHTKKEFRIFKLTRIQEIIPSTEPFIEIELSPDEITNHLNNFFKTIKLELKLCSHILPDVEEWLTNTIIKSHSKTENTFIVQGDANFNSTLIDKLITFSDKLTVLSPSIVIDEIKQKCKLLSSKYK